MYLPSSCKDYSWENLKVRKIEKVVQVQKARGCDDRPSCPCLPTFLCFSDLSSAAGHFFPFVVCRTPPFPVFPVSQELLFPASKLLFPASQLLPTLFSLLANAHLWPISYFSKVFSPFFSILRFCPFGNCWLMYCNEQGHKQLFLLTSLTSRSKRMCFLKISHNLATRWPVQ